LIKIVQLANGTTEFQPAVAGVDSGDRVHWNNETDDDHWLETDSGEFLTDNIPAGHVSNPGFVVPKEFKYRCKLHPQELGEIKFSVAAPIMTFAASAPGGRAPSLRRGAASPAGARKTSKKAATKKSRRKTTRPRTTK
jgi:hypothetical protein